MTNQCVDKCPTGLEPTDTSHTCLTCMKVYENNDKFKAIYFSTVTNTCVKACTET